MLVDSCLNNLKLDAVTKGTKWFSNPQALSSTALGLQVTKSLSPPGLMSIIYIIIESSYIYSYCE